MTGKQLDTYFQDIIRDRGVRALYSIQVFLSHSKASYRQAALRALKAFEWERVKELLKPLLADSAFSVKKEVIRSLAHFPEGRDYLQSLELPQSLQNYASTKLNTAAFPQKIWSVAEFIEHINQVIGEEVVQVEGEISAFQMSTYSNNQWVFFDLKDETRESKIRCFTTVFQLRKSRISPVDGMRVIITGKSRVSVKSGIFSLMVEEIQLSGQGELARAFELLRLKLEQEGLFQLDRKRSIPTLPQSIGLITSQDAAAYKDFMKVLQARMGGLTIYFHHAQVQGERAVQSILEAIENLNSYPEIELIVLTRGGGAMDDLHAFNDESVARAIFKSIKPIISAIGHERDTTIADFVADLRASTPSNAAELLTGHRDELLSRVVQQQNQLILSMQNKLDQNYRAIDLQVSLLQSYIRYIQQKLYQLTQQLERKGFEYLKTSQIYLQRVTIIQSQMVQESQSNVDKCRFALEKFEAILTNLDPQQILNKGYSLTKIYGKIITDIAQISCGDTLETFLKNGSVKSIVTKK